MLIFYLEIKFLFLFLVKSLSFFIKELSIVNSLFYIDNLFIFYEIFRIIRFTSTGYSWIILYLYYIYSLLNYYIFLKHFLNYKQEYFIFSQIWKDYFDNFIFYVLIKVYILEKLSLLHINIPFLFFNFKMFPKNEYKMPKMRI